MLITSKDNELIKHICKLKEKKYRDEFGEFIVEGVKMVEEAIAEKALIRNVVICEEYLDDASLQLDLQDVCYVSKNVFDKLTDVSTPQGILAVVQKENLKQIDYNENLFLILDNIQDPGNMGTILRTADSAGLNQIIISKDSADCFSPKVVRSSMGAIYRINIIEVESLIQTIAELKEHSIKVYATALQTEKTIYDVDYNKSAIIIGNESNGVSKEVLDIADEKIKIPMKGKTESLNASVATGIVLYNAIK